MLKAIKQFITALITRLKTAEASFEKHIGLSEYHKHTIYQVNKNVKARVLDTALEIYRARRVTKSV